MRQRGFTLVETLVAMVILAIGLLAVAQMSTTYIQANAFARQMGEATTLAEAKLEQLRKYAIADQPSPFSVHGFDYLVSRAAVFTAIEDPPGSGTPRTVSGLLSGAGGTPAITTGGTTYEALFDDGAHGDGAASDGVFGNTDTIDLSGLGGGFTVTRAWTVEPSPRGVADYARLTSTARWTDRLGQVRTVRLESLAHRRQ